jgi:hypothetical protein
LQGNADLALMSYFLVLIFDGDVPVDGRTTTFLRLRKEHSIFAGGLPTAYTC